MKIIGDYLYAEVLTEAFGAVDYAELMEKHGEPTKVERKHYKKLYKDAKKRKVCIDMVAIPLKPPPMFARRCDGLTNAFFDEGVTLIHAELDDIMKEIEKSRTSTKQH